MAGVVPRKVPSTFGGMPDGTLQLRSLKSIHFNAVQLHGPGNDCHSRVPPPTTAPPIEVLPTKPTKQEPQRQTAHDTRTCKEQWHKWAAVPDLSCSAVQHVCLTGSIHGGEEHGRLLQAFSFLREEWPLECGKEAGPRSMGSARLSMTL